MHAHAESIASYQQDAVIWSLRFSFPPRRTPRVTQGSMLSGWLPRAPHQDSATGRLWALQHGQPELQAGALSGASGSGVSLPRSMNSPRTSHGPHQASAPGCQCLHDIYRHGRHRDGDSTHRG